jgi:hypothetical protein
MAMRRAATAAPSTAYPPKLPIWRTFMTHHRVQFVAAFTAALLGSVTIASAQDIAAEPAHVLGEHPAVLVKRQAQQIDPNRFILMHPAGLFVIDTPSPTYDHPAVIVARMARAPSDLDRYMAQPPVASAWLRRSELSAAAAAPAVSH